ncbi:MAG: PEP-CTERM sorting domain-containing protein [Fuerstiella sp.]
MFRRQQIHRTGGNLFIPVCCVLFCSADVARAGVVISPVPGTETISLISNGGFETGNLTNWPGRIIGTSNPGDWQVTSDRAFSGTYSAKTAPARNFTGPGFSRVHDAISLTAGVEYVIGGYFYFDNLLKPASYIDLNDVSSSQVAGGDITFERLFDVSTTEADTFLANNQDRWIFAYESFTPIVNVSVNPRIILDRNVTTSTVVYVDDVFLSEASAFTAPQSSLVVPEPSSLALLSMGAFSICGYGWRRNRKSAA